MIQHWTGLRSTSLQPAFLYSSSSAGVILHKSRVGVLVQRWRPRHRDDCRLWLLYRFWQRRRRRRAPRRWRQQGRTRGPRWRSATLLLCSNQQQGNEEDPNLDGDLVLQLKRMRLVHRNHQGRKQMQWKVFTFPQFQCQLPRLRSGQFSLAESLQRGVWLKSNDA